MTSEAAITKLYWLFSQQLPVDEIRRLRDPAYEVIGFVRCDAEPVADWSQGTPLAYAQEVCRYWADTYDWRAREAALNRFDQFVTPSTGCPPGSLRTR